MRRSRRLFRGGTHANTRGKPGRLATSTVRNGQPHVPCSSNAPRVPVVSWSIVTPVHRFVCLVRPRRLVIKRSCHPAIHRLTASFQVCASVPGSRMATRLPVVTERGDPVRSRRRVSCPALTSRVPYQPLVN